MAKKKKKNKLYGAMNEGIQDLRKSAQAKHRDAKRKAFFRRMMGDD